MKRFSVGFALAAIIICFPGGRESSAVQRDAEKQHPTALHDWKVSSTASDAIDMGSHTYTYWKNLMQHNRTCEVTHQMKTTVYYCSIHSHTKSKTVLEKIIHSESHLAREKAEE